MATGKMTQIFYGTLGVSRNPEFLKGAKEGCDGLGGTFLLVASN
jgi:hypothetical protein